MGEFPAGVKVTPLDDQRKGVFKPEVPVAPSGTPQQRLLGYTGRNPT